MHDIAAVGAQQVIRSKIQSQIATNNSLPQNWLEFLIESSEEERRILNFGISSAISAAIQNNRAVYLDSFGIIFPEIITRTRREDGSKSFSLIQEEVRIPQFEKCTDLVSFQRQRFPDIIEGKIFFEDVAERISFFIKLRPKKLERYIRGLIALVRYEVIAYGHSNRLSQFGQFLALHNRQGATEKDWLSGADIFVKSEVEYPVSSKILGDFVPPILGSAWEPFEAIADKAFSLFSIRPEDEVAELGLGDLLKDVNSANPIVEVAAYRIEAGASKKIIFVTNGLRVAGSRIVSKDGSSAAAVGSELVFQVELSSVDLDSLDEIRNYARGPLSLGWLMMNLSKEKSLQIGIGISSKIPLWPNLPANFRSILTTNCSYLPRFQISIEGRFNYVSLVMLHPDEAQAVAELGSEPVLQLLKRRGADQVNRESRISVFGRTGRLSKNLLDIAAVD
jgi:hypothetical protein